MRRIYAKPASLSEERWSGYRTLKKNLLDEDTFKSLYKYRLTNLTWNKKIVNEKLIARDSWWQAFNDLLDRFAIEKRVREPIEETIGQIDTPEKRSTKPPA